MCMHVHTSVCMHTPHACAHARVLVCTRMYAHVGVCMNVWVCVCTCVHGCVYVCLVLCVHVCVCMGVCALCCVCMCACVCRGMCVHVCMHVGALCVCVCARVRLCVCVCQEGRVLSQLLAHPVWAFGRLSPQSTLLRWPPSWPPAVHHQSSHVSAALCHAHRGHRDTRRRGSSGREGGSPTQPTPSPRAGTTGKAAIHGLAQCSARGAHRFLRFSFAAPTGVPCPRLHQLLSPKGILCSARRETGRVWVATPASGTENRASPRQVRL